MVPFSARFRNRLPACHVRGNLPFPFLASPRIFFPHILAQNGDPTAWETRDAELSKNPQLVVGIQGLRVWRRKEKWRGKSDKLGKIVLHLLVNNWTRSDFTSVPTLRIGGKAEKQPVSAVDMGHCYQLCSIQQLNLCYWVAIQESRLSAVKPQPEIRVYKPFGCKRKLCQLSTTLSTRVFSSWTFFFVKWISFFLEWICRYNFASNTCICLEGLAVVRLKISTRPHLTQPSASPPPRQLPVDNDTIRWRLKAHQANWLTDRTDDWAMSWRPASVKVDRPPR